MTRQHLAQIFKWSVSIGLLWALVSSFDLELLVRTFTSANRSLLLLALAIGFGSISLSVIRWQASLAIQGVHAPFRALLSSTLVSGFLGFLLPSFGEDAVRGYDLYKSRSKGVNIAASIVFERICGLLGQVIVGGLALMWAHDRIANRTIVHAAVTLYVCVIVALLIVFHPSLSKWFVSLRFGGLGGIASKVQSLTEAVQLYRHNGKAWASVLSISLVFQFGGFLYFYVVAQALSAHIPFSTFVLLVPVVTILSLMPISVGGLGVKEGLFVLLFTQLGVASESAFMTSAVGSALYMVFVMLGGIVFVLRKNPGVSSRANQAT